MIYSQNWPCQNPVRTVVNLIVMPLHLEALLHWLVYWHDFDSQLNGRVALIRWRDPQLPSIVRSLAFSLSWLASSCDSIWSTSSCFGIMAVWVDVTSRHHHLDHLPTSQRRFCMTYPPTVAVFAPTSVQTPSSWTANVPQSRCCFLSYREALILYWWAPGLVILRRESVRVAGCYLQHWQWFLVRFLI